MKNTRKTYYHSLKLVGFPTGAPSVESPDPCLSPSSGAWMVPLYLLPSFFLLVLLLLLLWKNGTCKQSSYMAMQHLIISFGVYFKFHVSLWILHIHRDGLTQCLQVWHCIISKLFFVTWLFISTFIYKWTFFYIFVMQQRKS